MPHSHLRPKFKRLIQYALVVIYLFITATGISVLLLTPQTFEYWFGLGMIYLGAFLMIFGGVAGAFAAWKDRWRTERWSVPLVIGGSVIYTSVVWNLVIYVSTGRMASAMVATVFALCGVYRYLEILGQADRDRHEHKTLGGE